MKQPLRVLHLEDNDLDAELIRKNIVDAGIACTITRVETRCDFEATLNQGVVDLFLTDYTLPDFDGLSALLIAKKKCPDAPFVFVSGTIGEERAIEALKQGASDYVFKDKLSVLAPRLRRACSDRLRVAIASELFMAPP